MALAAGSLNRRILVEKRAVPDAFDGHGGLIDNWVKHGTFAARRMTERPTEAWQAGKTAAKLEAVWRLRWSPSAAAITAKMRLTDDGRVYEIIGATETGWRGEIQLVAIGAADNAEVIT